jgi:hypothetical protein
MCLETVQLDTIAVVYEDIFFLRDGKVGVIVQKPGRNIKKFESLAKVERTLCRGTSPAAATLHGVYRFASRMSMHGPCFRRLPDVFT